jgi:Transposase DDE domain
MRSGKNSIVSASEVHQWALQWLVDARLIKDHGPLCTVVVVWSVVLRAAARMISVFAACRDLAKAPSQQAIFNALTDGLPRTLPVLENRLNEALIGSVSRRLRLPAWQVAIDWHLEPYYGEPQHSRNEIYNCKPKQGTSRFHAYATACIVQYGERYTLALTWVRQHETTVVVLRRLLTQIRKMGLKIKRLLMDRAFFSYAVTAFLQEEQLPFLMPVMFRGRKPKKGPARTGLHAIKREKAGWYHHTLKNGKEAGAKVSICVAYRSYRHHKTKKRKSQKLLFSAWRVHGSPTEIRELYRKRFGIESSFRQLRQARIYTCTRNPHLRLVFIAIALLLRNLWVWIHATKLAEGRGKSKTLRSHLLRFKRLLDWIAQNVVAELHDGSLPYVDQQELT